MAGMAPMQGTSQAGTSGRHRIHACLHSLNSAPRRHLLTGSGRRRAGRTHARRPAGRLMVEAVIPRLQGDPHENNPPDLPSYLFKERIVYLGMSLVPSVTELILAELLYLQYKDPARPVYMYINSQGVTKGGDKLGYESEAFAIYDTMSYVKPEIRTLCVGNAFGESAMLLAAGEPGQRGSLPSASIMLRQPYQRFNQMQATDIDIYRNEIRKTNAEIVRLLAKHTKHTETEITRDINRPQYYNPQQAVDYGIIDRVLEGEEAEKFKVQAKRF